MDVTMSTKSCQMLASSSVSSTTIMLLLCDIKWPRRTPPRSAMRSRCFTRIVQIDGRTEASRYSCEAPFRQESFRWVAFELNGGPYGTIHEPCFCTLIAFPKRETPTKPVKVFPNPMMLAHDWNRALEQGMFKSQADLASHFGTSATHVNQMLSLLKLAPDIVRTLTDLGPSLARPFISMEALRSIKKPPPSKQKVEVHRLLKAKGLYSVDLHGR
jgi:hypothetical protein